MTVDYKLLRLTEELLLLNRSHDARWSVQGLGMMRYYLCGGDRNQLRSLRLHIWHSKLRTPGVSTIHTHPWGFTSHVVAGRLVNQKYSLVTGEDAYPNVHPYMRQGLICGTGGHLDGDSVPVRLFSGSPSTVISPGQHYSQGAEEIHETEAMDGTITLVERRKAAEASADRAEVFWPAGHHWVSAEPRPAHKWEVVEMVDAAIVLVRSELVRLSAMEAGVRRLAPTVSL